MKKLLKSEIYGSVNSVQYVLIGWKLFDKSNFVTTIYTQCMNSSRNNKICTKTRKKKKKEKKNRKMHTQTQTPDPNAHYNVNLVSRGQ